MIQLFRTDPTKCSVCDEPISDDTSNWVTKFPCPFEQAKDIQCDLVIALSAGQFGVGFEGQSGIHIGICDSKGQVLEFDKDGILFGARPRHNLIWRQCARLDFLTQLGLSGNVEGIRVIWDETVETMRAIETTEPYDDNTNNCLNFVQTFLCKFITQVAKEGLIPANQQVDELTKRCSDKVEFCRHFVLAKTKQLARYIALEQKLQAGGQFMSL